MSNDENRLPVMHHPIQGSEDPSCSPKNYVSNEEASLLAAMRELHEASLDVRRRLKTAEGDERAALESALEELRRRREEAGRQRERAFTRKMIMLGHLPPDYPVER